MKKFYSLLSFFLLGMIAFAQNAKLTVDDVIIPPGGTATISLHLTGATQFVGAGMYIAIPKGLTFVYDEDEESYVEAGDVFAKSHQIADRLHGDGVLKFIITSASNAAFKKDEGTLVEVEIMADPDLKGGTYQGEISTIEFSKTNKGGLFTMENVPFNIIIRSVKNLTVSLPNEASDGRYKNMYLILENTSNKEQYKYIISDRTTYTFNNIAANTTYNIYVKNAVGNVFGTLNNVKIDQEDVTVAFQKMSKPCTVNLRVITPDSTDVTQQATISWYTTDGNYLAQDATLGNVLQGTTVTYKISIPEKLAMLYEIPAETSYTVQPSNNNINCVLKKFEEISIAGKISDITTNSVLSDATVSISQLLNGKYTKTTLTKTGRDGFFKAKVFHAPTTVTVAANDYISKTFELEDITHQQQLDNILLSPITGARISIDFTYTKSTLEDEETEVQNWYDDYVNVAYTLYNETKNKDITEFSTQYPQIVLLESVDEGDMIRITATSRTSAFTPVTTRCSIDETSRANAIFNIIQLGQISASFKNTENTVVVGTLYDSHGKYLKSQQYNNAEISFTELADGDYTLLTMANSNLFNSIYDINQMSATGLKEGSDYILNKVTVKSGLIEQVHNDVVPTLDETKLYYTGDGTSFFVNKPQITTGNYLTLTSYIDFKEEYADMVDDIQLIVDLPEECVYVDNSLMVGINFYPCTYEKNRLIIPLSSNNYSERIRFCIIPTLGGNYAPSAYVKFKYKRKTITQPIGSANYTVKDFSIYVPAITDKTTIPISGTAIGTSNIEIYDNGVLIGQTTSLANGTWATTCKLNESYNLSTHQIYAKVTTKTGLELQSETQECQYDMNAIEAKTVIMSYYNKWSNKNIEVVFNLQEHTINASSYTYYHDTYFTFIADLTNNDPNIVSEVTIRVYTDQNNWRNLEAKYDKSIDRWVAVSYFESKELPVGVDVVFISMTKIMADRECFDANLTALENKKNEILQIRDTVQSINMEISILEEEAIKNDSLLNLLGEEISNEISKEIINYNRLDELLASYLSLTGSIYSASDFNKDYIETWDKEALNKLVDESEQIIAREDHTDDLLKQGDILLSTSMQISTDESSQEYETDLFKEESDTISFEDNGVTKIFYEVNIEKAKLLGLSEDNRIELPMTDSSNVYVYYENSIIVIVDEKNNQAWVIEEKEFANRSRKISGKRRAIVDDLRKSITKVENLINDIITFANGLADPLRTDIRIIEEEISKNENWKIFYRQQMIQLERDVVDIEHQIHQLDQLPSPTTYSELYNESGIKYQDLQTRRSLLEKQLLQKQQKIKSLNWKNIQLNKELGNLKKKRILKLGVLSNIMDIVQIGQGLWQVIDIITYEIQDLNKWKSFINSIDGNYNCETKDESDVLKDRAKALKDKSQMDCDRFGWRYKSSCAITFVSTAISGALTFNKGIGWIVKMLTSNISSFINDQAKNIYNNTKAESETLYRTRLAEKEQLKCKKDDKCPRCGKKPCVCKDKCPKCGNKPCTCNKKCPRCGKRPCICKPAHPQIHPYRDPSGYVYEGVPSNRLQGVTATVYYKEMVEDMYGDLHENIVKWNAEQYAQENPLFTDGDGFYRWDVPQGLWQVKFEKEGYETTYSEWLPVPPPQLDVNIAMKQVVQPEVKLVHAYKDGIDIEFDKYMLPTLLNEDNITVTRNNTNVKGTVSFLNEESIDKDNTETYVSKIRFVPNRPITAKKVNLTISKNVKSYADIQMQEDFVQTFEIEQEVTGIVADSLINITNDEKLSFNVSVLPAEAAAGKTLHVTSSSSMLVSVENEYCAIDENGQAEVIIQGGLPGLTALTYAIDGYDISANSIVNISMKQGTCANPTASIASGSFVDINTSITLTCSSDSAIIYYTTDGSCPCDETGSRKIYDGTPIILTENTTIKAMATAPDLYDSDVVEFIYNINSNDGIEEISMDENLKITPIHVKDKLTITAGGRIIKNVNIINMNGIQVLSTDKSSTKIKLNVSSLPTGTYIVNVTIGSNSYTRKIIKE